jgi:putative secretion ATPase (PEP-CTERM system associated)
MYESHFGFSGPPFQLNPDPSFLYESANHGRALSYLRYGVQQGEGFIVITGDIGAGKTTLVRALMQQLDSDQVVAAHLANTQLESSDLLHCILTAFGVPAQGLGKGGMIANLEALLTGVAASGRRALLVVDEAQNLSAQALEELRMLSNFQLGSHALLQSFLVGQPELRQLLQGPSMEQLRQRILASYHLGPLSSDETAGYIRHRLQHVGWRGNPPFDEFALSALHACTGGVPRRINLLCNRVLLAAYLSGADCITSELVQQTADELSGELHLPQVQRPMAPTAASAPTAPAPRATEGSVPPASETVSAATPLLTLPDSMVEPQPQPQPQRAPVMERPAGVPLGGASETPVSADLRPSVAIAKPETATLRAIPAVKPAVTARAGQSVAASAAVTLRTPEPQVAPLPAALSSLSLDLLWLPDAAGGAPGAADHPSVDKPVDRQSPAATTSEGSTLERAAAAPVLTPVVEPATRLLAPPVAGHPEAADLPARGGLTSGSVPHQSAVISEPQALAEALESAEPAQRLMPLPRARPCVLALADSAMGFAKLHRVALRWGQEETSSAFLTVYIGAADDLDRDESKAWTQGGRLTPDAVIPHDTTEAATRRFRELLDAQRPLALVVIGHGWPLLYATLAARQAGVPVVRLDAGSLRGDTESPVSLVNTLIDRASQWLFCSGLAEQQALAAEGVSGHRVARIGRLVSGVLQSVSSQVPGARQVLAQCVLPSAWLARAATGYGLITAQFTADDVPMEDTLQWLMLARLAHAELPMLWLAGPDTARALRDPSLRLHIESSGIVVVTQLGPLERLALLSGARCVLCSFSKTMAEEALAIAVPVVQIALYASHTTALEGSGITEVGPSAAQLRSAVKAAHQRHDLSGRLHDLDDDAAIDAAQQLARWLSRRHSGAAAFEEAVA